jgi:hypothetical protein
VSGVSLSRIVVSTIGSFDHAEHLVVVVMTVIDHQQKGFLPIIHG